MGVAKEATVEAVVLIVGALAGIVVGFIANLGIREVDVRYHEPETPGQAHDSDAQPRDERSLDLRTEREGARR